MLMASRRKLRGTALVVTPKGILVVKSDGDLYMLPGGQPNRDESRRDAAIRELKEETGLISASCTFLFEYTSPYYYHAVYLITASGEATPQSEIRYVDYYRGANIPLFDSYQKIIQLYKDTLSRDKTRCPYCNAKLETGPSESLICQYCDQIET